MKASALWTISVSATPEVEAGVVEAMQNHFGLPPVSHMELRTGRVMITVYSPKARDGSPGSCRALREALSGIPARGARPGPFRVTARKLRYQDWGQVWKRHFKAIEIGSALLIKPGWIRRRPTKGQAVVVLDPGLSFGTGQHPTTAFCLRQLVRCRGARGPKAFLDIGTGSGILAIAAAKLGYAPIEAFDVDPQAVRTARSNAHRNRVEGMVRIRCADLTRWPQRSPGKYDVICANLVSDLLLSECGRIAGRLKSGGCLVLAGILDTEFRKVAGAYLGAGFELTATRKEGEWRSGAFSRRPRAVRRPGAG